MQAVFDGFKRTLFFVTNVRSNSAWNNQQARMRPSGQLPRISGAGSDGWAWFAVSAWAARRAWADGSLVKRKKYIRWIGRLICLLIIYLTSKVYLKLKFSRKSVPAQAYSGGFAHCTLSTVWWVLKTVGSLSDRRIGYM